MQVNLSDSEWKLMNRLWEQSPLTIMELTASLKEDTGWSKNTVITMLARLEAKGAVRHEEGGRAKRYFPAVDREDAAAAETESFLSRVYGGSLGLMMRAMVESRQLTVAVAQGHFIRVYDGDAPPPGPGPGLGHIGAYAAHAKDSHSGIFQAFHTFLA